MDEKQQAELAERIKAFMKGYELLVKTHEIDFASWPVWTPDGQGGFKTILQNQPVDIRNIPKASPFMGKDGEAKE